MALPAPRTSDLQPGRRCWAEATMTRWKHRPTRGRRRRSCRGRLRGESRSQAEECRLRVTDSNDDNDAIVAVHAGTGAREFDD